MAVSRTWYVPCSPRNPEKIAPELSELIHFKDVLWRERDANGALIHQVAFANRLRELETFEGSISASDPAFSARDRLAPMQTYGFAYIDSQGRLKITPAGEALASRVRIPSLFLRQFLKWQYPSWQHGGNPRTRARYLPASQMNIFPFVETLRVCRELGGLSKEEIAIFLLPVFHSANIPSTVQAILDFRREASLRRGRERKEFIEKEHQRIFSQVYAAEIEAGKIRTRESTTATVEEFLRKKMRNSLDVADAVIRYFRASGLFTLSADFHGLSVSEQHQAEVDYILDSMSFTPVDFYDDVDRFYEYLGDPNIPSLPWEERSSLIKRAVALGLPEQEVQRLSEAALRDKVEQREYEWKEKRLERYIIHLQKSRESVSDIVEMFHRIRSREVVDPPLFLEWNVWRAMVALNDCRAARPNFVLDDDLQPYSHAPGNKADIEVEYNDTFVVLVEVTLQGGARQYDTEGEPVTRHIGRFQRQEIGKSNPRAVYGLFIAPSIDPNTQNYFYVHMKHLSNPDFGGFLNIVPLTLEQFTDIFKFCKSLPTFNRAIIRDLLERLVSLKDTTSNADEWRQQIPQAIAVWKQKWGADASL